MHKRQRSRSCAAPAVRRVTGAAVLLVLSATLAATSATPSGASNASTPYVPVRIDPPDAVPLRWGERLVSASLPGPLGGNPVTPGDLDSDGVNDFWTAAPFQAIGGNPNQGRVFAVSGKTFQVIYRIDAPIVAPGDAAAFGFYISSPGDVTGDGKPDVVVGTDAQNVPVAPARGGCVSPAAPEPNGCNENQGQAWMFNGADGSVLYTLNNPTPQGSPIGAGGNSARFGSRIGRAGDINGDAIPDIILGASNQDVCNTAGCATTLATLAATPGSQAGAGNLACGDISPVPNGCGKNQGQAFIYSGNNGALLRTINIPDLVAGESVACTANCGTFGLAVQSPGDLNGDTVPDQQVDAANLTVGGNVGQGRVYLFSGFNGALLARVDDPVPQAGATFGFQDAAPNSPGDINGDGVPEIYANGFGQNGPVGPQQGRAWIFDGASTVATGVGQPLVTVDDPSPEVGGQFGWSMTTTDYDNDNTADYYVAASPRYEPGATGSGGSYVFSGPASAAAHAAVLLKALELPEADRQTSVSNDLGPSLGWALANPGDLDGDGNQEYLAGAPFENVKGLVDAGQIFAFQSRERPPAATFDGNNVSDVALFRPSTGQWFVNGGLPAAVAFGAPGDIVANEDYNGDGMDDMAVFRPSTGEWYIHSNTGNATFSESAVPWGISGDIPVPGDYNGDGRADVTVFRPSTGIWYTHGGAAVAFGTEGDIPVPGDYTGDGVTDRAVFRPSTGTWYVQGGPTIAFGTSGDIPVPGDYNGDTVTDIAVFRPSTGIWYFQTGGTVAFGTSGDIPVPGDYNGNGTTDIAVFRPSTGLWYVQGGPVVAFGTSGDQPVPLPTAIRQAFVP